MKKKIIAIALALCMVTSLLPATVLAASEGEPQCTVTEGCTLSNGHEGECVLPEEGGEPDAPAACTKTEGCTLAEGHEGVCVLPEEGGEPDAPAACTKTEGCTLAEGHEGACVLPEEGGEPDAPAACTKTEGCTLAEGHEGECVLPKENGEPVVTMLDGVNTPEELETALAAGGTVVLSGNITIDNASKSFTIQNAVTLDLNGFSITRSGDSSSKLFAIKNNGSLTLNDSKGTGTVNSTYPVQLYSNATFIMNGGTITSSHGAALDIYTSAVNVKVEINGGSVTVAQGNSDNVFGIRGKENVKVDIKGGDILGAGSNRLAMYVSGDKDGAIELNINGGSVQHTGQAIQAYSGAVINLSGDAVIRSETNTAISTQSGYGVVELNMTGGTISTGSSTGYAVYAREKSRVNIGGGNVTGGTAVMVYDSANVTVTGGTLEGKKAAIGKGSSATPVISVTGGKFSSDVKEFVPEGNTTDTDSEGNFIVVVDKAKAVAEANGVGYTTVQAAIDAVANSDAAGTVKLLQSKAESVAVPAGANVTLDIPAGVTLTNTNGAHTITNSGTLAITGEGTVDNVTHAKGALVNLSGAQAVIRGGMLTRSSEASTSASQSGGNSWYVIDNHGTLEIAGGKVVNEGHFSSLIRNVGDSAAAKAVLTISGGEVEQMGFIAVKNDDNSILNVTGGVIRSNEQAVQNWTQANISGGRLEGNVITWAYGDQPSETNIAGSAVVDGDVAAVNYMDAAAQPVVNITGGTVTGSIYKGEHKGSGGIIPTAADSTGADINVSGGAFKKPVDPAFCAEGFAPNKDPITGDYTVHTHAFVKTEAVAASCAAPGTEAYWTCSVCGKLFSDEAGANEIAAPVIVPKTAHTLVKTEAVAPTCTKEGSEAYWTCSGCGKLFSDGNGANEIAAPVAMSKTAHTPVAAWSSDGSNHWHVCSVCGEKLSQGTHTFGEWHTTLAPTATKTGVQEKNCTVCGYGVCATVPATGMSTPQTGDPFNVRLFVGLLWIGTTGLVVLTGVQLKKHRAGK